MKITVHVDNYLAKIKVGSLQEIYFKSDVAIESQLYDFALWAVIPLAMRLGEGEIHFGYKVSQKAYNSANQVARVWANWAPEIYSFPNFTGVKTTSVNSNIDRNCTFFSGGLDSTYSAIKLREESILSDSITVHGMDYWFGDHEKFDLLMNQTYKFRKNHFANSYSVRTNIYEVYDSIGCNPFDGQVTHVFALFACGSLFNYSQYFIAADYRLDQQYTAHPYGSNFATNSLMHNAYGSLVTRDYEVGRGLKAKYLFKRKINLDSLSICANYEFRPRNCGVCEKCMRTKVLFFASSGVIPNIFNNKDIPSDWFRSFELCNKVKRVFFRDILDTILEGSFSTELNYSGAYDYWKEAALKARLGVTESFTLKLVLKRFFDFLANLKKRF